MGLFSNFVKALKNPVGWIEDTVRDVKENPEYLLAAAAIAAPFVVPGLTAGAGAGAAAGAGTAGAMTAEAALVAEATMAAEAAAAVGGSLTAEAALAAATGGTIAEATAMLATMSPEAIASLTSVTAPSVAGAEAAGMAQISALPPQTPIVGQPLPPIEPLPPAEFTMPTVDATSLESIPFDYSYPPIVDGPVPLDPTYTGLTGAEEGLLAGPGVEFPGYQLPTETGLTELTPSITDFPNPTSFGNTYADPSFLDKLKVFGQGAKTLSNILGPGLGGSGGSGGGGIGGGAATNYEGIMSQLDPYWGYRKNTEIPMMGAAADATGTLSGLYQQSFTNPLQAYNTPEMQALNAQFMEDIQRKDAAAGRMSQYGARDVQAQNQYLTNTLPAYRQNLQQGLGTLYNAAKVQPPDAASTRLALDAATDLRNKQQAAMQGTVAGSLSNLQGSWNQMTGSNNVFDQVTGAVNTASNVADLYNTGTKAWNTLSGMFKM